MANSDRRLWPTLWRILGVAGDLHFGWQMLVQYILPNAAVAGLVTYLAGWRLSFSEYLAALPLLLQAGFFVCLFVVTFALINHAGQRLPGQLARRGEGETSPPVSGEVTINAGRDVTNYGEIAGVIQKFGMQARTLTDRDVEVAVSRLANYPHTAAMIGAAPGVPDGAQFANVILNMLQDAQWAAGPVGSFNVVSSEGFLPPGVVIDPADAPDHAPFEALCQVLNDPGVQRRSRVGDLPGDTLLEASLCHAESSNHSLMRTLYGRVFGQQQLEHRIPDQTFAKHSVNYWPNPLGEFRKAG